jgi:two-component system, OmpR family, alkaline phosphatase synthesis response regulator PhoP
MNKDITLKLRKILLVDDNPRVRSFVKPALEDAGFKCLEAEDGWTALEKIIEESPDLVVLDIMLGDETMNGLDVCRRIRQDGNSTPVIFLTIKDRSEDPRYLERAFQLGADDYVTKREELRQLEQRMGLFPTEFLGQKSDVDELIARIKVRLSIQEPEQEFDNYLKIDPKSQTVKVNREGQWQEVHLTSAEFSLLNAIIKAAGRPVGKVQLMDVARIDGEGSLQNHVYRLRSKIEKNPETPEYILTYHGLGYRFKVRS